MAHRNQSSLVTTQWLADHLNDPGLVVVDGGFKMPGSPTTAAQDYAAAHISGAVFFDIDAIADRKTDLPHMFPPAEQFGAQMGALGISNDSFVVAYDGPGLISAGRIWWTFRMFGHDRVAVLDGGLRKWIAEGLPVTTEAPVPTPKTFRATLRPQMVRSKDELIANLATRAEQVIDARSVGRFAAIDPEPRPGLRGGHIPGSLNLPFGLLSDAVTGEIKPDGEIRTLFQQAGLDFGKPVVASCGSGVTAAALGFALHVMGKDDVAIYDGSWAEWGRPGHTPVEP